MADRAQLALTCTSVTWRGFSLCGRVRELTPTLIKGDGRGEGKENHVYVVVRNKTNASLPLTACYGMISDTIIHGFTMKMPHETEQLTGFLWKVWIA